MMNTPRLAAQFLDFVLLDAAQLAPLSTSTSDEKAGLASRSFILHERETLHPKHAVRGMREGDLQPTLGKPATRTPTHLIP